MLSDEHPGVFSPSRHSGFGNSVFPSNSLVRLSLGGGTVDRFCGEGTTV